MISQNIGFSVGDNVILSVDRYYDEINDDEDKFEINFKITGLVGNNNSTVYLSDEFLTKDHGYEKAVNNSFKRNIEDAIKDQYSYELVIDDENMYRAWETRKDSQLESFEFEDNPNIYAVITKT